jgi:hypothetical protein
LGEKKNAYGGLVGKLEGRLTLEKPRPVREGCIKLDLREAGWKVVDLIHLNRDKEGNAFFGSIIAASFLISRRHSQKVFAPCC